MIALGGETERTKLVLVLPPRLMRAVEDSARERNLLPTELVRHALRAFLEGKVTGTESSGESSEGAA